MNLSQEEALDILEIEDIEDQTVMRKAYHRLSMKWHPDKNPDNQVESKTMFQKVNAAYNCLMNPEGSNAEDGDDAYGGSGFFDEDDEIAVIFFKFMMHKMYGRPQTFVVPPFSQRSSYVPPQRQHVPMAGPSGFRSRYSWEEFHDDSDDSEADFDFSAAEEREFLRAEQQKRQAAARQQRAQEQRERTVRKARAVMENQAKVEETREAEQSARAAAEEAELLRRVVSQLPRPIMASRTETSITLSLARLIKSSGGDKLPKQCVWELEMKTPPGGSWHTIHPVHGTLSAVADHLRPGTKYIFRARAAHKRADGSMDWGKCSEESHYATAGKSPAAESASAASSDASRKGKKREAAVRKEERRPQQPAPSKSQELSEEAEQQRLQAEKQKEAAIKAAQERAAQEYEREVEQLNAMKLQNEARINEKVKKAKQKARKKEEAVHANEAEVATPGALEEEQLPRRELPPRPPPYRAAPVLRPYNETFADCFGSVQRSSPGSPAPAAAPAPSGQWAGAPAGQSLYADDDMNDAEMAQLVAALEDSEQSAKQELEARQAMRMSDTAFPSLPASTARPGQSISGGPKMSHVPPSQPTQSPPAGPVPGGASRVRPQPPPSPVQAQARSPMQPPRSAQHLNGQHASSPGHQPPQPLRQQLPAQQQTQTTSRQPSGHAVPPRPVPQHPEQALRQQPSVTGYAPTSRLSARNSYSPQVPAHAGGTPQQQAPQAVWEAPPEDHCRPPARKLGGPQVPAHAEDTPQCHAQETQWEAPPEPQHHAADWEWEPVRQTDRPQVPPHASTTPYKQAPDMGWEPVKQTHSLQVPAHAGSMPHQHTPEMDWEAPPEEHHRQPVRQMHSAQVPPHPPGFPTPAGCVPPRRLNGHPVKLPARQQLNGTHQQNGIPAQQTHAISGHAPVPAPRASPARVKLAAPVRKAYHSMGPPSAQNAANQSHGPPPSTVPDILRQLMPRSGA